MSSEVTICNLALSHIGDTANVSSISPPEGTVQAQLCARFYPLARDVLLESHSWGFATKRVALALLSATVDSWLYAYAIPTDVQSIISVLPPEAADDYSFPSPYPADQFGYPAANVNLMSVAYMPQPYQTEEIGGQSAILTNQADAVLRYTAKVTDPTKFTPLFRLALSHMLASMLAGPILKGDVGKKEAKDQLSLANHFLGLAKEADSADRNIKPTHSVPWMSGR